MLDKDTLKNLIHYKSRLKIDNILLILAFEKDRPKTIPNIKTLGKSLGIVGLKKWNVSQYLAKSNGAIKIEEGWELSLKGIERVQEIIKSLPNIKSQPATLSDLNKFLPNIKDKDTQNFVRESINCFEHKLYRSAVVLSWVGAISLLQEFAFNNKLSELNSELLKTFPKWKPAKTKDDLSKLKESDFLNVLEKIKIVGKDVRDELKNSCLKLRNSCGHPNSLRIGEHRVSAHIESLILNVFSRFS